MIFAHADLLDQIMLALSCKYLLQTSTLVVLKTRRLAGHRVSHHRSVMEQLLKRVRLFTATGRRRRTHRICVDCLQYRPTRISYWEKRYEMTDVEMGTWVIYNWAHGVSLQCPKCRYDGK
jgi:hypothetical protein